MKRILVLDFLGNCYTHHHSKTANWPYEYIKNLQRIIRTFKVDHTLLLCEGGTGSHYRTNLHPEYKSTRKARRAKQTEAEKNEYKKFIQTTSHLSRNILPFLGIRKLSVPGTEADDLWGYLGSVLNTEEYQILALTEDTDWHVLLRKNIVVGSYRAMTKFDHSLSFADWIGPTRYKEINGLTPEQMFHTKLLTGDTSDDIPGIEGIGKTTAFRIIEKYGSIENVLLNKEVIDVTRLSQKSRESLKNCEDVIKSGFKLMNLTWPLETWQEILGEEGINTLNQAIQDLDQPNPVDQAAFEELCFENGWLDLDEEWLNVFI